MKLQQLEEKKQKLYDIIKSPEYRPMKRKQLRVILGVPEQDRLLFEEAIEQLLQEGKICETKKGKLSLPEVLQMATGTFFAHAKGFGFITPDEQGSVDIFIPAAHTNGALHKDRVMYQITSGGTQGRRAEGVVIRILERGMKTVVGKYESSQNFGFVLPDDVKFCKDIYIPKSQTMGAVTGHKVVVEITNFGDEKRGPEGKIIEILGHINDPGVDVLSIIRRHEITVEFPKEVYTQIEHIPSEVQESDFMGREDFRQWLTITIDGEDAKDLDDAVTLKMLDNGNYELGVHIADVSHYVQEHTPLDQEGYLRGTSVYLVDRVIPMLPHKLSNGICSLNPHVDRLTLSCIMELNAKGEVIEYRVVNGVIHSNYRMTYHDVREILEDNTSVLRQQYSEIVPMLEQMNQLREILHQKRNQRGSVNFDLPESKIILNEQGKVVDIKPYERSIATNLIEEFMLICNETVAEAYFWQEIPFVFRSHQEPDEEKLQKLEQFLRSFGYHIKKKDGEVHPREIQRVLTQIEGKEEENVITRIVLRSMMQARYTSDNQGHFGLAAKYYCHFTSPIRRYPDLQIHRLIKKALSGELSEKKQQHYQKEMPEIAAHCSKRERIAEQAERDTIDMKKAEYMENKIGEEYEGIISSMTNWGMFVTLSNTVEGVIAFSKVVDEYFAFDEQKMRVVGERSGKIYTMGDKVRVVVIGASKELGTVDFMLSEMQPEK